ncbi:hypothetical protein A2U01_0110037, partial [Trifolium medium]|nr:hypothetical protein [Trifolium medium]
APHVPQMFALGLVAVHEPQMSDLGSGVWQT